MPLSYLYSHGRAVTGCFLIMLQSSHAQKVPLSQLVHFTSSRAHLAIPTLVQECIECDTSYAIPLLHCIVAITNNEEHYSHLLAKYPVVTERGSPPTATSLTSMSFKICYNSTEIGNQNEFKWIKRYYFYLYDQIFHICFLLSCFSAFYLSNPVTNWIFLLAYHSSICHQKLASIIYLVSVNVLSCKRM